MPADWIATYRLQLHAGFSFSAAARVLPYLAKLGISHVYLSPIFQARAGSRHGYDVVDPTRISTELGGDDGWREFIAAARAHGLRVLLDIVPNHMATSAENPWWDDLLAHGPFSAHAGTFDVVPRPEDDRWRLHFAPLGQRYGDALAAGELKLALDPHRGPRVTYYEHSWPLAPASFGALLGSGNDPVFEELAALGRCQNPSDAERADYRDCTRRATEILHTAAGGALFHAAIDKVGGDPERLHEILQQQFYALHHWKLEGELANYRRFFDVGGLVGVRMETEPVFDAAHRRLRAMIEAGELDGVRVDHPDGLCDPAAYLEKLRALLPQGRLYVEKILEEEEHLRDDWPVDGTVGYDFLSRVNRLWMDHQKKDALTALYSDFTKHTVNFPVLARDKKRQIAERAFAGDLERLTERAWRLSQASWRDRDLSRTQLSEAIARITTSLPVYRTYRRDGAPLAEEDRRLLVDAIAAARVLPSDVAAPVWDFLQAILTAEAPGEDQAEFIRRWQQLSPAVTAKGIEDTTFYLYDRLVSCNEVGAPASSIGIPSEKFHEFCHHLAGHWPNNLLATSTHDNKRSEDVRTRISVLTEVADRWGEVLHEWTTLTASAWKNRTPDRHAEYLLYQTLVGAWPLSQERCWHYMLKACREAKIRTSWHEPNPGYEESLREFIGGVFALPAFIESLERFIAPLIPAGRINSLAQTLIKLTAPGVPDFYQGTELWDLSLVDPDNRRPVDYDARRAALERCGHASVADVMARIDDGEPKLWLIARTLRLRAQHPAWFGRAAAYRPLVAQGARTSHLLAYQRGERVIVAVPRFTLTLAGDWRDTHLRLPEGKWINHFTGTVVPEDAPAVELFGEFPVALLVREDA